MEVLSLSQTSLYFGYGKNQNKQNRNHYSFLLVSVNNLELFFFFWSDPESFHIKVQVFVIFTCKLLKFGKNIIFVFIINILGFKNNPSQNNAIIHAAYIY